jgi:phosphatidylserine decarboxylase
LTRYATREIALGTAIVGVGCALALWKLPWLAVAPVALWAFVLCFFRDPERVTPEGENRVVAPADGRVADVEEVREDDFLGSDAVRVGIFMSLFDVHVNRAPLSGKVLYRDYRPGKFGNAMFPAASRENECSFVGIERPDGLRLLVKQIAGLIARRIVCECPVGGELKRGERFGMVKFGSRLEVYVPKAAGFRVAVAVGDRVRAGSSVLGEVQAAGGPTA